MRSPHKRQQTKYWSSALASRLAGTTSKILLIYILKSNDVFLVFVSKSMFATKCQAAAVVQQHKQGRPKEININMYFYGSVHKTVDRAWSERRQQLWMVSSEWCYLVADKTRTKLWAMCGMRYANESALPPQHSHINIFFFFFGPNKVRHLGFFFGRFE